LHALAALPSNRALIAGARGVRPLVALFDSGVHGAIEQASGALAKLVVGSEEVQAQVAEELVAMLLSASEEDASFRRREQQQADEAACMQVPTTAPVRRELQAEAAIEGGTASEMPPTLRPAPCAPIASGAPCAQSAPPAPSLRAAPTATAVASSSTRMQDHVTSLMHVLATEPENRAAIARAGAIPQLAAQVRDCL
jgi:hypothetical protein